MNNRECYDHRGHKFKTKAAMCKYWKVHPQTFDYRRSNGWTVERALTTPSHAIHRGLIIKDHTGKKFSSVKEMIKYWGVSSEQLYYSRKQHGWNLKECLTGEHHNGIVKDHKGREFKTVREMTEYWNVPFKTYYTRKYCGWSLEECLTGRKVG